jgi:hypothetical protein
MAHRAGIRWDHARWIDERRLLPSASRSSGNGAHARRKPQPGQSMRWPVGSSSCGHDKHHDNPASELFRVNEFCPPSGLNGLREKGQNHGKYCGEMLFLRFCRTMQSSQARLRSSRSAFHAFGGTQRRSTLQFGHAGHRGASLGSMVRQGATLSAAGCWPHSAADGASPSGSRRGVGRLTVNYQRNDRRRARQAAEPVDRACQLPRELSRRAEGDFANVRGRSCNGLIDARVDR